MRLVNVLLHETVQRPQRRHFGRLPQHPPRALLSPFHPPMTPHLHLQRRKNMRPHPVLDVLEPSVEIHFAFGETQSGQVLDLVRDAVPGVSRGFVWGNVCRGLSQFGEGFEERAGLDHVAVVMQGFEEGGLGEVWWDWGAVGEGLGLAHF